MHSLSVAELQASLRTREISSVELTEHYLSRIARHDGELNSFITVAHELAMSQARQADALLASGNAGPLTGIPILHKDLFCTAGVKTSCGSRMLDSFIAPYNATVVEHTNAAGMPMLGKANMDEFAMGSSNENSYYGPVKNPWDTERVPGGSSGGSAAAVAARLTPLATGTDTGGSIRQPAALTGITGIKPTYGRVSRYGMVAFASSLDQGGTMGRSAADAAALLQAIAGFDQRDSTSVDTPVPAYPDQLSGGIEGLRIGLPSAYFGDGTDARIAACVEQAVKEFERLGAKVVSLELETAPLALSAYYVVALAECSSNLSRYDGIRFGHRASDVNGIEELYKRSRSEGFGKEVIRRILIGTYTLSAGYFDAYYLKAQKIRRLISQDFQRCFQQVDVLMGPTSPIPAFKLGEKTVDPISMYRCDINTTAVNLAGIPAMSIPVGFVSQLPVGLQIIGNYFAEQTLLRIAHQYQLVTDWHLREPDLH